MSSVRKFAPRYTVDQYAQWQGDWELWEGVAIAMIPSPFGIHQGVVTRLSRMLGNAIEAERCDAEPLVELDWIISQDTVVRPDVVVICGTPPERHLEQTPTLVAEVLSDSTQQNDLHYKRQLYQRQGVAVYLMVDPAAQTIQVDRLQPSGSYRSQTVASELSLQLCQDCEIQIATASIFRR